jgi:phytoene dehydrogenase-like protein
MILATPKYDVIVVGAGPGGCASAALLQKWGMKTLLLDKNDRVGGKSLNMNKGGFTYELWPVLATPMLNTKFHEVATELGVEIKMSELVPATKGGGFLYRPPKSKKYESFILVPPFMIPERLTKGETDEVNRLFSDMAALTPTEMDALDDVSFHDFLSRYNISQSIYSYLAVMVNILFVEPIDLVAASEMAKTMNDFTTKLGSAYFVGGQAQLFETFMKAFKRDGGDLRLRTRVERIIVEDSQVQGVYTDKGTFKAPIVVSNAGIQPTVLKLVGEEHFDKGYANHIRGLIPSMGLMGSRYFLDKVVFEDSAYIIYSDDSWWNMERYVKAKAGEIPKDMLIIVFNPQGFDPKLAPKGKQVILTATLCVADPKMKNTKGWLDALDEQVAKFNPELRKHTVRREDYTTADVSRVTRDSVVPGQGGECIGLGQIVGQCGHYKPSPVAPIQGLFYVGVDSGGYGVGIHHGTESAVNVAPIVLRYHQTH